MELLTPEQRRQNKRESDKRYYQEHREQLIQRQREYRAAHLEEDRQRSRDNHRQHKEERSEYQKAYNLAHATRILERVRIWNRVNAERLKLQKKAWRDANIEKARRHGREQVNRRRILKMNAAGSHSSDEISALYFEQNGRCAYCGIPIYFDIERDVSEDHVIPLTRGGSDAIGNILLACRSCNAQKNDKTPDEWEKVRGW